jgi:hypothetical protein
VATVYFGRTGVERGCHRFNLHHEDSFRGLPAMASCIPFITEYLGRLLETTQLALSHHLQVFAVVFDLCFADDYLPAFDYLRKNVWQ